MRTLIIDNYDSFTFNLYQLIARVAGDEPIVVRNDPRSWDDVGHMPYDNIVLSPGPGRPDRVADFGICARALREATAPILGVCLGHQGIALAAGGQVVQAPEPMHGRVSTIHHDGDPIFAGIPREFAAVRYHSLMAQRPLPDDLEVTAWSDDGVVMGLRHRFRPIWGVQFHPESIGTEYGERLLDNFNQLTRVHGTSGRWSPSARRRSVVPAAMASSPVAGDFQVVTKKLPFLPDSERAFTTLHGEDKTAFWLDSSMVSDGLARFSFMGNAEGPLAEHVSYRAATNELTVTRHGRTTISQGSLFDYLRQRLATHRVAAGDLPFDFNGGFVGYLGYELKRECGGTPGPESTSPDAQLLFADRLLAFDAHDKATYLVALVPRSDPASAAEWLATTEAALTKMAPRGPASPRGDPVPAGAPPELELARGRVKYIENVHACLEHLRAGDTYEVCLTNTIKGRIEASPLAVYQRLRRSNPAPYAAYLALPDIAVACSSPERFLRVDRTGQVDSKPIKGTAPRGRTAEQDEQNKETLRTSEKERAENLMIVDLVRNDLGVVCEIGSVTVPKLMQIETYATVHQMVSTVRGHLRSSMTALDAVRACFPGGSMTGAPKKRTMEILDELEGEARGVYAGSIGYLGLGGAADLNIVIRTAVFVDGVATIGVGGAVVALSDAAAEYDEIVLKSTAVVSALLASVRPTADVEQDVERLHRRWRS